MVHGQIAEYTCFYLDFLGIGFPFHFIAGFQFHLGHHPGRLEHGDTVCRQVVVENNGTARLAIQTAPLCFGLPLVAVTVPVKTDGLADFDIFADHPDKGSLFGLAFFHQGIHFGLEIRQLFGHGGVEGYHRARAVGLRTHGPKLETVSGKGERRRTVTVSIVYQQLRNLGDVQLHPMLALQEDQFLVGALLQMVEHTAQLRAEERGNDGRGRLVGSQTMGVGGTHDGGFQQTVVPEHGHQGVHDERDET